MQWSSSTKPLAHRGFQGLFAAQLLGIFNDNLFKMIVSLLAVQAANVGHSGGYLSLAGAVFIVPYLIFSGYAGYVADRFDKRHVLVAAKAAEIVIMALAFGAMIVGDIVSLLAVLFLLATQATFFSPAKYGILPEMLPVSALPRANGALEMSRYIAVIIGTVVGGFVLTMWANHPSVIGLIVLGVALAGYLAGLRIPPVCRSGADKPFRFNPWAEVATGVRRLSKDPRLMSSVAGITFFEFLGALILLDLILVGKEVMRLDDARTALFGAFVGFGIGLGSLAAGRLSRGKVELGMAPLGALGVGVSLIAVSVSTESYALVATFLVLVGIFGGLFFVPLNATLQLEAGHAERGHLIATNNFINMAAVLLSAGVLWLLHDKIGITSVQILFLCGVLTLGGILCAFRWIPGCAASTLKWTWDASRWVSAQIFPGVICVIASCGFAGATATAKPDAATNIPSGSYSYAVGHPLYGNIGTFAQTIEREHGDIVVRSELKIDVRLFSLFSIYQQNSQRTERWRDGRLQSYHGRTLINGVETAISGFANGDSFLIRGQSGVVRAPASVFPSSPWSVAITQARVVMSAESGRLIPITVEQQAEQNIMIRKHRIRARHYKIFADGEYQLWYDLNDVPVRFILFAEGVQIDFTLQ